ncbi:IucA/IucC family protein [Streptantibioticus rubrisoli]|uniref:Iron transporter n=1 Tax=Streptantibioticus rubrisoli TaxID=1387313 RepID=A0ABT1PI49_9ACTN|nr:IucA/IucC family protein [Streptantibioticus rubrisoli]MCQ4045042.1 iron transporter [Streptantibioticus rubrisoli]
MTSHPPLADSVADATPDADSDTTRATPPGPARGPATPPAPRRADTDPAEHDGGTHAGTHTGPWDADPLEQQDAYATANHAGVESLLRCWVRETGGTPDPDGTLRLPLIATGITLRVPVRHWSAVGTHRFGPPAMPSGAPVDAVTLAVLLARETGAAAAEAADLAARVADSVGRTTVFVADRRANPAAPPGTSPFLDAEQSLLLGHPLHPTPKSRQDLSGAEARAYSPEARGAYPLHWMAVDRTVLATDSAWTDRGRTIPADRITAQLAGPALTLPPDSVALPLHPWQAREVRHRPQVRQLLDAGLLHDLGPYGTPWHPTSSIRTVYRPDAPAMLKLSLAVRITNSRRENLRKELVRGVEVHRLLRSGLARQWHADHPRFDIVRDPAWLAVDSPDGEPVPGLDVVLRHVSFGAHDDVNCVAGLTSERPWPGCPPTTARSRLADLIARLAARTGRPGPAVATEWFLRYLHTVVSPVLWLDGHAGVALEAHQQNTLVLLDADGWPTGGRYRDNQGYYFRESRRAELDQRLPGIGTASETFVCDEVADERFAYYLGINNALGLIGAFGAQRLADEQVLLAAFRRFLTQAATDSRSALPERLLHATTLRCKANLLTRLHGLDELVGPVDTQSVYVTIPNPLAVPAA